MIITLKNKETLICEDFVFRCSIGRNGITKNKKEGDKKTPSGIFGFGNLYYRKDKNRKPNTRKKATDAKMRRDHTSPGSSSESSSSSTDSDPE